MIYQLHSSLLSNDAFLVVSFSEHVTGDFTGFGAGYVLFKLEKNPVKAWIVDFFNGKR